MALVRYPDSKSFSPKNFEEAAQPFVHHRRAKLKLKLLEGNPCCSLKKEKLKIVKNCAIVVLRKMWSQQKLSNQNCSEQQNLL